MTDTVALASVILAIGAISLSLAFFWMSFDASRNIQSSVDKLEKIYDILLNKMFEMIDKTLVDYQKHAWKRSNADTELSEMAEREAEKRIKNFKKDIMEDIEAKISEISKKTRKTDAQIEELQASMERFLDRAIAESRLIEKEVNTEILKDRILIKLLEFLGNNERIVSFMRLYYALDRSDFLSYMKSLIALQGRKLIYLYPLVNIPEKLSGDEDISLTFEGQKRAEKIWKEIRMGRA
jgi:hypothetical protein